MALFSFFLHKLGIVCKKKEEKNKTYRTNKTNSQQTHQANHSPLLVGRGKPLKERREGGALTSPPHPSESS